MIAEKKSYATLLIEFGLPVITACSIMSLSRATFYRKGRNWYEKDKEIMDAIQSVLVTFPNAGFWKCYKEIRLKGYLFNNKRVYRVYLKLGLNSRDKYARIV